MEELSILNIIIGWLKSLWHIPFPPKPQLKFEEQEIEHWFNIDEKKSGINVKMFIINRGKKPTSIRKICMTRMEPDHLKYLFEIRAKPFELKVGKDTPYRTTYFFRGSYLRYDEIEFDLEFTHTEGTEKITCLSKKATWLL
jgi:hypothetical protein